jgi:hypothetical protein
MAQGMTARLSPQREAYAVARARGLKQRQAAMEAGAARPDEFASRAEKRPEVKARIAILKRAAAAVAEQVEQVDGQGTGQGRGQVTPLHDSQALVLPAVADLAECLQWLTMVKRSRAADYLGESGEPSMSLLKEAPAGLVKGIKIKSTTDENGQVYAQHEVVFESAMSAVQTLVKHYQDAQHPADEGAKALRAVAMALLVRDPEGRKMLDGLSAKARVKALEAQVVKRG